VAIGGFLTGQNAADLPFLSKTFGDGRDAYLRGESLSDIASSSVKQLVFGTITFGIGPEIVTQLQLVQQLANGQISNDEYNERSMKSLGGFAFNVALLAVGARAGRGRATVIEEGAAETAAKRSPLRDTMGRVGEMGSRFKEGVGELGGRMKQAWAESARVPEYVGEPAFAGVPEVGGFRGFGGGEGFDIGRPLRAFQNFMESRGTGGSGGGGPKGWISYGELDALNRPTGVEALITKEMLDTGSDAAQSIKPPGWSGDGLKYNEARGHLLGKQLGGSGKIRENLVTIEQNPTNSPFMRDFESSIKAAVRSGETVRYSVEAMYKGANPVPQGITMSARGSGGFSLDLTILNKPGR
jgi:hypothetical protein